MEERKTKEQTLPDLEDIKIQAELREAPPVPDEEPAVVTPVPRTEDQAPAPEVGEGREEKQAEGNRCTTCRRPAMLAVTT